MTLDDLRRHAVARTLFAPTTLGRAIERLGFVQADPIRAPARAQDLTLRHRVAGYRAGDLERRYARLPIDEDCFVNYGFLPRRHLALMHPRTPRRAWDAATRRRAAELLAFIREHGPTHPRDALAAFDHGRTVGYWGGMLNATTQLLDGMHYRGLLRVVRRDAGTRVYEAVERVDDGRPPGERARALLDLVLDKYAPLPSTSLTYLARLLRYGAPQLAAPVADLLPTLRGEWPSATVDGLRWFWPAGEDPASRRWRIDDDRVRLLAPFDPIVWDRPRFERLWGWRYKFEAYTPPAQRRFGHYALPLLHGDRVVGWVNASVVGGRLTAKAGLPDGRALRDRLLRAALDDELARMSTFLGCG